MMTIAMDTAATLPLSFTTRESATVRGLLLKRRERLLRLRRQHEPELNRQGLRLLDRAVFAAYCACREAGVDGEARHIISQARQELRALPAGRTRQATA